MQLMAEATSTAKTGLCKRETTTINQEWDAGVATKPQRLHALTTSNLSLASKSCIGLDDRDPGVVSCFLNCSFACKHSEPGKKETGASNTKKQSRL
jgi:hypothetical protein